MTSLISLLKEIGFKTGQIYLKDLEYDKDIDLYYPIYKELIRKVTGREAFDWWKKDMVRTYGPNLIIYKRFNPNKEYWYQGKYKLEVAKTSNPENQKYWND